MRFISILCDGKKVFHHFPSNIKKFVYQKTIYIRSSNDIKCMLSCSSKGYSTSKGTQKKLKDLLWYNNSHIDS